MKPNDYTNKQDILSGEEKAVGKRKIFCFPPQRDDDDLKPENQPPSLREAVFGLDKSE